MSLEGFYVRRSLCAPFLLVTTTAGFYLTPDDRALWYLSWWRQRNSENQICVLEQLLSDCKSTNRLTEHQTSSKLHRMHWWRLILRIWSHLKQRWKSGVCAIRPNLWFLCLSDLTVSHYPHWWRRMRCLWRLLPDRYWSDLSFQIHY